MEEQAIDDAALVREEDEMARRLGVSGVPCVIVERRYAISGAQSPEVFLQAHRRIAVHGKAGVAVTPLTLGARQGVLLLILWVEKDGEILAYLLIALLQ